MPKHRGFSRLELFFSSGMRAFQHVAVVLISVAFLCTGAQAAGKHSTPAASKKATATIKARTATGKKVATQDKRVNARALSAKTRSHARGAVVVERKKDRKSVAAARRRAAVFRLVEAPAPRLSHGQLAGLHNTEDALELKSSAALVVDQETQEVLFSKNDQAVLPIASLTKLMTGLLVSEARLPLGEAITITQDDVDTEKGSRSRLTVGVTLNRGELLHLALMSSENRAAHALGRTYPGGLTTFVSAMNAKARALGMRDTRYVEPTGLSSNNQSTAQDLALLVNAASADPRLREYSTSPEQWVEVGNRVLQFNTTNGLVRNPEWDIGLQKTGYISEAGKCLVMQARIAGRKLIMVFLDSAGKSSRIRDAERVRRWVEATHLLSAPAATRVLGKGFAG